MGLSLLFRPKMVCGQLGEWKRKCDDCTPGLLRCRYWLFALNWLQINRNYIESRCSIRKDPTSDVSITKEPLVLALSESEWTPRSSTYGSLKRQSNAYDEVSRLFDTTKGSRLPFYIHHDQRFTLDSCQCIYACIYRKIERIRAFVLKKRSESRILWLIDSTFFNSVFNFDDSINLLMATRDWRRSQGMKNRQIQLISSASLLVTGTKSGRLIGLEVHFELHYVTMMIMLLRLNQAHIADGRIE